MPLKVSANRALLRLTIYNLGCDAVRSEDWDVPATITFPEGRVVQVVTTTNSAVWNAETDVIDPHTVRLRPVLMNYFDKITLNLAVDRPTAGASMRCRIVGQTRDPVQGHSREPSWWTTHVPESVRAGLTVLLFIPWLGSLSSWLIRLLT
jgi:hypothetical protein